METYVDRWMNNYIDGVANFIAKSAGETPEETEKEKQEIKKFLEEKVKSLRKTGMEWEENTIAGMRRALKNLTEEKEMLSKSKVNEY